METTKREWVELIITVLVLGSAIAFGIWALVFGTGKQDQADCYQWQREAATYPLFYLTKDQKAQCDYWQIKVAAPVK
jgi:hypothetical protein